MWKDVPKPYDRTEEIAESKTPRMTDEGTRYHHLTELLTEWETGLEIARKAIPRGVRPLDHVDRTTKLYFAIEYLKTYIDYTSGFKDPTNQYKLSKSIEQAHVPEYGGRG